MHRAALTILLERQGPRSLSVNGRQSCQITNATATNPNAIDTAAAIASNVHIAVSSGGQFIAAGWLAASAYLCTGYTIQLAAGHNAAERPDRWGQGQRPGLPSSTIRFSSGADERFSK